MWSLVTLMGASAMCSSAMCISATLPAAPAHPRAEQQALELAKQAIALRSVRGPGNQTPQVAALFKSALVAGGFPERDITITPIDDTAYLIARWPGSNPKLKPLVISGHMDVVEAIPADWQRDPFTPVIENGLLFGRGASDMKLDDTLVIAALLELKRQGYKPRREIILEFSGDEETTMKTSAIIAKELSNADLVLNVDGGGGLLDKDGKPVYLTWEGAEKMDVDFELTVTNPGGHSSAPREDNAITRLAAALVKIGAYKFKPELNDISRAYFTEAARFEQPEIAAAMREFAADPGDAHAAAVLRANPSYIGRIGTTCVATRLSGGHALNALPQRATANIDCRIFPGHTPAEIMAELETVAADPAVQFKDVTVGSVATDASPIRQDLVSAVTKAIRLGYPGVPVFPSMSSGASDSMWFRHENVSSYGVSPMFMKTTDHFSHGLNERAPVDDIAPSIAYLLSLVTDLSH
jgi:acetylornithine deacetylase/succinyl-diaminopimelate desuccinylase-like protein